MASPLRHWSDARLFERMRRMQNRFDALCQRLETGFASTPESEGLAEIEAAVAEERSKYRSSPSR